MKPGVAVELPDMIDEADTEQWRETLVHVNRKGWYDRHLNIQHHP